MSPQSLDEFVDLVDQAIFEIDEVLLCVDDEGDEDWEFSDLLPVYERLSTELKALHQRVVARSHPFANETDLSFMPLARQWRDRIPFMPMLEALNQSHRRGLKR